MILIVGTPDSGKSMYAENMALSFGHMGKVAYIATMIAFDNEGIKRIEKHRKMREGKGFVTYEKPQNVHELIPEFKGAGIKIGLLECISNLVGNEMYSEDKVELSNEELSGFIVDEVCSLDEGLEELIVVTNQFEVKSEYDDATIRYIELINVVNDKLKGISKKYVVKTEDDCIIYENS